MKPERYFARLVKMGFVRMGAQNEPRKIPRTRNKQRFEGLRPRTPTGRSTEREHTT